MKAYVACWMPDRIKQRGDCQKFSVHLLIAPARKLGRTAVDG